MYVYGRVGLVAYLIAALLPADGIEADIQNPGTVDATLKLESIIQCAYASNTLEVYQPLKNFRAQFRGVKDKNFFLFRLTKLYA